MIGVTWADNLHFAMPRSLATIRESQA